MLSDCRHHGPLRVQKALYPEGQEVCQAIVLHPPSGIAGGDRLHIAVNVGARAHAQLTTPGAGKWYRSGGQEAVQELAFDLADEAILEWLPQETIVFDGARARMETRVNLSSKSRYIGWEVLCLGRRASGETFSKGELGLKTRITRCGLPLWLERGSLAGGDALLASIAGWAGASVSGSLLATIDAVNDGGKLAALLAACRAIAPPDGAAHGITALPGLFVARYLGDSSEAARHWFTQLWQLLRPTLIGRPAQAPRIWTT